MIVGGHRHSPCDLGRRPGDSAAIGTSTLAGGAPLPVPIGTECCCHSLRRWDRSFHRSRWRIRRLSIQGHCRRGGLRLKAFLARLKGMRRSQMLHRLVRWCESNVTCHERGVSTQTGSSCTRASQVYLHEPIPPKQGHACRRRHDLTNLPSATWFCQRPNFGSSIGLQLASNSSNTWRHSTSASRYTTHFQSWNFGGTPRRSRSASASPLPALTWIA